MFANLPRNLTSRGTFADGDSNPQAPEDVSCLENGGPRQGGGDNHAGPDAKSR